jgi:hypothetical protein
MEQSSQNENVTKNGKWVNCEIRPNEISIEEEPLIDNWKKKFNLQTKKLASILLWSKHNFLNIPYYFFCLNVNSYTSFLKLYLLDLWMLENLNVFMPFSMFLLNSSWIFVT